MEVGKADCYGTMTMEIWHKTHKTYKTALRTSRMIACLDVVMSWPQIPDEELYKERIRELKDREGNKYNGGFK